MSCHDTTQVTVRQYVISTICIKNMDRVETPIVLFIWGATNTPDNICHSSQSYTSQTAINITARKLSNIGTPSITS